MAGTTDKCLVLIRVQGSPFEVEIRRRDDLGILAVQGPQARGLALPLLPDDLRARAEALSQFQAAWSGDVFVARTGYTGEDGFELVLPHAIAVALEKIVGGRRAALWTRRA